MRPIPDGIGADPDSGNPAPAGPRLCGLAKPPTDPLSPHTLCNHQPADQSRRLGLEVVLEAEIDPPDDRVVHARHQHRTARIGSNPPYPCQHNRYIRGITKLSAQNSNRRDVVLSYRSNLCVAHRHR